ncbi:phage holin family protein [Ferruginibacter lapsinanis]|uniref:phage holin family protein n=1 Tax=Ferruginibacter lapsinanis TaxID=563172 RepID=UPI001E5ED8D3|nr:phage holin family protein [Ferruginibacter lapsinanis]UEG49215.1 phage holin family protein [Ferruginibacter lapsinanis]
MRETFAKVEEMIGTVKEYVNVRIESVKLDVAEICSDIISSAIAIFIAASLFLFFILFASIALSIYLNEYTRSSWSGFLIVGCLHLLLAIIIWIARERLIRLPVMNALIKKIFNDHEED